MEKKIVKIASDAGGENSRKTKSLDLLSIYKSRASKEGKKGKPLLQNGGEDLDDKNKKKKKRKSGKKVALDSLEAVAKKSRKSLDEGNVNDVRSDSVSVDSGRSLSGLSQKNGLKGLSFSLGGSGNVIHIPQRPRGLVRRKKFEGNGRAKISGPSSSVDQVGKLNGEPRKFEPSGPSSREAGSDDMITKLVNHSGGNVGSKVKRKRNVDEAKESGNGRPSSSWQAKDEDEDGHVVVNNGDASSKKRRSNHRKRKDLASGSKTIQKKVEPPLDNSSGVLFRQAKDGDGHVVINNGDASSKKQRSNHRKTKDLVNGTKTIQKKVEPPLDNSSGVFDDFQDDDDDEEKLEQNAARMLSSRFDPRCTGFTSNSRSSGSPSDNATSFSRSCHQDFVSRRAGTFSGFKSKDTSRVLRPRKQPKDKDLLRKRRHFYEISSSNLDAFWFLNRRIKVFWPLDESWYHGIVDDYDPQRKLHHVEYDDRDEEWIVLHNEKFKLLLLPSEVPCKAEGEKSPTIGEYTHKRKTDSEDDDSCEGIYLDSEPIISWLSRSTRRVKSSPSSHLKKQKRLQLSSSEVSPVLSTKTDDTDEDVGSLGRGGSKSNCVSVLSGGSKSAYVERAKSSLLGSSSSSQGSRRVVYVRRRLRKDGEGLSPVCENDEAPLQTFTSSATVANSLHTWERYNSSLGCSATHKLSLSIDDQGLLSLRAPFGESKSFRFEVCLPALPLLNFSLIADCHGFSHALVPPHYGSIKTAWPEVSLEILFVDNAIGLRFLLFEGCLKLAVELFSLILTVFYQSSGERKFFDMQLPITSIRFKLSQDLGKHQEFAFYSFSKLNQSKWLYLDSKLQRHCLLSKQLPVSECTYDNMKTFEGGSFQHTPDVGAGYFPVKKRLVQSILPMGVSRVCPSRRMSQSAVNSAIKLGKIPSFTLSCTAAPTFFLNLHLKLLMERNFACISFQDNSSLGSFRDPEVDIQSTALQYTEFDSCPENVLGRDVRYAASDDDRRNLPEDHDCGMLDVTVNTSCSKDLETCATNTVAKPSIFKSYNKESEQSVASPVPSVSKTVAHLGLSNTTKYSSLGGLSIELPSFDSNDKISDERVNFSSQVSDFSGNTIDGVVHSPYATGLRSSGRRDRNGSNSSLFGDLSSVWPDGKLNFMSNGFGKGPKKPRTRVQYTFPPGGFDFSSIHKSHNQRAFPYKRIRRSNEKQISDSLRSYNKNLELLSCDANVLVTLRDKGWRECGARIVLELADQNEWRLAVNVSGITKYSYKVNHILQPGSTNRYTHAMMWKGGKDWVLEFPDRSQWVIFKEMHEECHNRNIRAASVKNIPIPGVHLTLESDDYVTNVLSICNSAKYYRQVESDVDMAINPLHALYDMDSDDEDWILENSESLCTDKNKYNEISCELFEKMIDMLEKLAYSQQRDQFTVAELEGLMVGIDSMELIKGIYEHWWQKRQRKGMPLIRHFQPPLWEIYEQQVKDWERAVTRAAASSSIGSKEKSLLSEKPPMFAFCLKPRGLDVPNKGSKQRSQRRFPVTAHNQAALGDQDGFHTFGRRLNGFAVGEEKSVHSGNSYEFSDSLPSLHTSTRVFSPHDAGGSGFFSLNNDVPEWNHYPKYHRNKPKKNAAFPSSSSSQLVQFPHRIIGTRNGANMDLPEWTNQKHHMYEGFQGHVTEQLDGSDLHEFTLRDASGAAQHALNMAKMKREKAQRLLYRADLAIHRAVVALMTAEAKKAALDSSSGDGQGRPCDSEIKE
ncbi:hypothetical protein ACH5RR_041074 [Cinchona calisaya]|uniref:Enhancer of polycomb-like protein n=1 Tax=Cinchona calisaya TaxID=153742 RepID=A0ABD2XSW9_9GENT